MQTRTLPNCPRAVLDARALIADPERAAQVPQSLRAIAWHIAASARGATIRQRRRASLPQRGH